MRLAIETAERWCKRGYAQCGAVRVVAISSHQ